MTDPFLKNHFYHIFNRGCNKEKIFFRPENYTYLLQKMEDTCEKYGANIIAYCLMPNHYHFLAQQTGDKPLSNWLQTIFNGYAQAVNKQQGRSGTLFEGRAEHKMIKDERYLIQVALYIHYNPVDAGLVKSPEDWVYSNYLEWIEKRNGSLVDRQLIKNYFQSPGEYADLMNEYDMSISLQNETLKSYIIEENLTKVPNLRKGTLNRIFK